MTTSKNYVQLSLAILLYAIGSTNSCSAIDWNAWNPWHDPLRSALNDHYLNEKGEMKDSSIKILENVPEGERYGVCHNYAISKTLGIKGQIPQSLPIMGCQDWYTEFNFLGDYCQKITNPQKGDLIVYKSNWGEILHTGLIYDPNNDLVESKWGTQKDVLVHPTFRVPEYYGNYVEYYRPVKSSNEIIQDMQQKVDRSHQYSFFDRFSFFNKFNTKKNYEDINKQLLEFAENEQDTWTVNFKGSTHSNTVDNVWGKLNRYMHINVDTTNDEGQTPLMLTAKRNNTELARLLITYKANINHQDKEGNTALITAAKHDNMPMISLL